MFSTPHFCRFRELKLAPDEHSWSVLFRVCLPVYLRVYNNLVPRKEERLQLYFLLHILPEEALTVFAENFASWYSLALLLIQTWAEYRKREEMHACLSRFSLHVLELQTTSIRVKNHRIFSPHFLLKSPSGEASDRVSWIIRVRWAKLIKHIASKWNISQIIWNLISPRLNKFLSVHAFDSRWKRFQHTLLWRGEVLMEFRCNSATLWPYRRTATVKLRNVLAK